MRRPSALSLAPWGSWLLALLPALLWTVETLSREAHHANAAVLLGAAALGLYRRRPLGPLTARLGPLALAVGALLGFLVCERTIDVSLLSAAAAFTALYGLYGLYVSPGRWRRARAGWLLCLAALPIVAQAHHYAGFALRIFTARVVAGQLADLGLAPVAAETILVLERGVAHVEAACSGLGSVWAGSLLLLGVAFGTRAPVGLRWLIALLVQSSLLLLGNIVRITTIVALSHHWGRPDLAQIVHEPLGVLGFVAAGIVGVGISRRRRPRRRPRPARRPLPLSKRGLAIALALTGLAATAAHHRRPAPPAVDAAVRFEFAPPLVATPKPLSTEEADLFRRWGAQGPSKFELRLGALRAEAVLVPARNWRAHHPPALCLAGSGHRVDGPRRVQLGPVHAMHSTVDHGAGTAVYWFQALDRTTPELLDRIQDGVLGDGRRWVLVTVLLDRAYPPEHPALTPLITQLQGAIDRALRSPP